MFGLAILSVFVLTAINCANAAPIQPLERRIDQTISDATKPWQDACIKAGGTQDKCSGVAVPAFTSLLEAGGVCDQQNAADAMIDLAKQLGNDPEMIRLAQIFVQQPRNSPNTQQIPYCQVVPKNEELSGLFHCQFSGSDFTKFSGDQSGNVPLGLTSLTPPGSCPANPEGPVQDGVQLNTLVHDPIADTGINSVSSGGNVQASSVPQVSSVVVPTASPSIASSCNISP